MQPMEEEEIPRRIAKISCTSVDTVPIEREREREMSCIVYLFSRKTLKAR